MRILDCFTYFNEKELLELRIKLLYDVVDKFIISEGDHTHRGNIKSYTCEQTFEELNLPTDKVEFVKVKMPNKEQEPSAWVRERAQRNVFKHYVLDNDVAHISDCDEILNPDIINKYANLSKNNLNNIVRPLYHWLSYTPDYRVYTLTAGPAAWIAGFFAMKHHFEKYTPSLIREQHCAVENKLLYENMYIKDNYGNWESAGWHFNWMGGKDKLKTKINEYLHWNEVSIKENYNPDTDDCDVLGRKLLTLKKYPKENLPAKIFELENVRKFLYMETL
jgi:hypothetical protein